MAEKRRPNHLTDYLIVEIQSRLPVKSVVRFKCVSRRWRRLISGHAHRRKLPQTLSGVLYHTEDSTRFPKHARHFVNLSANLSAKKRKPPLVCPSLSFLPGHHRVSGILDGCNGLLLCRLSPDLESSSSSQGASFCYLVCNPATKSWVILPGSGCGSQLRIARLGFDPAVSLHFHVFEIVRDSKDNCHFVGLQIYSSETRAWRYKESKWSGDIQLYGEHTNSFFLNGLLHLVVDEHRVVVVDVKGETWWTLAVPDYDADTADLWNVGFLGRYQGKLCYINACDEYAYEDDLSVWVLKDYATSEWTLKHHVSIQQLCESPSKIRSYYVIAVHPDRHIILYVAAKTLMAYDIDHEETRVIKYLGHGYDRWSPTIPYVPFYTESLTDGQS